MRRPNKKDGRRRRRKVWQLSELPLTSNQTSTRARGPPGEVRRPMLNLTPRTALVVHPSHATARHWRMSCLLLRPLCNHRLGGNQQTCDRSRSLQCVADHLRWVDDTLACEIAVLTGLRVVAEAISRPLQDLADHN